MKALYPLWGLLALSQSLFAAPLSPADRSSIEQQQQQLLLQNQQQRDSLERAVPLARPAPLSLNSLHRRPVHVLPSAVSCLMAPRSLIPVVSRN